VPADTIKLWNAPPVDLQDYWLDKYEVTNKQFKQFVDSGGYQKREFWKQPFVKDGRSLSWEQAMLEFRDSTGRPGPSTWELGTYAEGQADFPVGGVSWYEAAAYAEYAGKTLPTIYHWFEAAGLGIYSDILRVSNFSGVGPARVGAYAGLGPYGTYDMAGNVKEWCWNRNSGGWRYILGGAWDEPSYAFIDDDVESPFKRLAEYGFRCAKYMTPVSDTATAPIDTLARDYSEEKPIDDEIYKLYKSFYSYDRTDLKPVIESTDDSPEYWRKEKITLNAAYGGERVTAYLFLPKKAPAPFQTVVFFPAGYAFRLRTSENLEMRMIDLVIRSGRALLYPIYKGTYERHLDIPFLPNTKRDMVIQWSKDLGRSIDYLETRKDIDMTRLAYYGISVGANDALPLIAIEKRLKTAILQGGGFNLGKTPPETEGINFAPRIKIPFLMLNGRDDFEDPLEASQLPLFRLLGTPETNKRHVLFDSGHSLPRNPAIKEVLDWLDRFLGPVGR
jgi:eukaryotic-like serine/threonine-protein kinase